MHIAFDIWKPTIYYKKQIQGNDTEKRQSHRDIVVFFYCYHQIIGESQLLGAPDQGLSNLSVEMLSSNFTLFLHNS